MLNSPIVSYRITASFTVICYIVYFRLHFASVLLFSVTPLNVTVMINNETTYLLIFLGLLKQTRKYRPTILYIQKDTEVALALFVLVSGYTCAIRICVLN